MSYFRWPGGRPVLPPASASGWTHSRVSRYAELYRGTRRNTRTIRDPGQARLVPAGSPNDRWGLTRTANSAR